VVREYRFTFDDKVFKIGASVGLTEISPHYNLTLSELLSTVDSACYTAKEEGGNRIHIYRSDDSDIKEHNNQLEWVSRIHLGLEKKQFVLYIQRMASLSEGAELHCELLIRMQAMDGSYYPPGYFLPAAERYHLMPKIDRWVVGEALSIIARKGASFPYVCAINLSGQTLSEEGFLEYVIEQIKLHKVDTRRICFEITETSVIANLNKARQFMHALREIGCRFSLDDFGSGLSSFAYLKNLEVDFLKIDGMFVKAIVNNKIDRAMVESINNVGHVMGLHTIAEFAENDDIINMLKEIGVDYAQGYGVAKPELFE
jgi:EAL domain-containing protein (putative c-di-GMP-specific phosphodiesterase class I)